MLVALLLPLVAPQRRMLLACFVAFLFGFPIVYEITLWGFQTQVYLALLLGIASPLGLPLGASSGPALLALGVTLLFASGANRSLFAPQTVIL